MRNARQAASDAAQDWMTSFWSAASSAQAAAVTIALRTPILIQAACDPFAWPARREALRATTEKWEAGMEGAIAAFGATAKLWTHLALQPGDIGSFASGLNAVADAATRPAYARVRKNARRLSRG
ncbi:hypothetical protein [Terrarubrum flagellatum]|uniref:hypothetical protein n=1 Tax=Terrirubrum flagellatum TaxID=2895980 RepID=UPI0031450E08